MDVELVGETKEILNEMCERLCTAWIRSNGTMIIILRILRYASQEAKQEEENEDWVEEEEEMQG